MLWSFKVLNCQNCTVFVLFLWYFFCKCSSSQMAFYFVTTLQIVLSGGTNVSYVFTWLLMVFDMSLHVLSP